MIAVFLSFVTSPDPTVKMIGLGLAVAVLVDATIVRLMLVPATMELLGNANWWLPQSLERLLPHINVEGSSTPKPAVTPEAQPTTEPEPEPVRALTQTPILASSTCVYRTYATPKRGFGDGSDGAELEVGGLGAAEPGLVEAGRRGELRETRAARRPTSARNAS